MNSLEGFAYRHDGIRLHQYQRAILTRLPLVAAEVTHFDELLQWLGEALIHYFHIQVTQFWVGHHRTTTGQLYLELRMMVFQNPFLSQEIVVNPQMAEAIERIFLERRGLMPQSIDAFFPPQQTQALHYNHLSYWSCYFMSHGALLPAAKGQGGSSKSKIPFSMAVTLLFQEMPHPRLLPVISFILEQAIVTAKQYQLLKPLTL